MNMIAHNLLRHFSRSRSIFSTYSRLINTEGTSKTNSDISSSRENLHEEIQSEVWKTVENESPIPNVIKFREQIRKIIKSDMEYPNPRKELFLSSYTFLSEYKGLKVTENCKHPYVLALCMEMMMKSSMLILDSFSSSYYEHGRQTLFGFDNSNPERIPLSIILESGVQKLLRKSYHEHNNFRLMNKILHDIKLNLLLEKLSTYSIKPIENFDERLFDSLIHHGVSFQNFELPTVLATLLAEEYTHKDIAERGGKIFYLLGKIYQIRKDFQDFELGELGYDIEDNRCTWLITEALQKASPAEKKILKECYGVGGIEKAAKVRQIYQNLDLHTQYPSVERRIHEKIQAELKNFPAGPVHALLDRLIENFFKN